MNTWPCWRTPYSRNLKPSDIPIALETFRSETQGKEARVIRLHPKHQGANWPVPEGLQVLFTNSSSVEVAMAEDVPVAARYEE